MPGILWANKAPASYLMRWWRAFRYYRSNGMVRVNRGAEVRAGDRGFERGAVRITSRRDSFSECPSRSVYKFI